MKRPLLPFLLTVAAAVVAHAQSITWTNTAGGNWSVAANWNPNQVPGPGNTAIITNDGTYTVTVSANVGVNGLSLGGDSGAQTLSIAGGTFTLNGTASADSNGLFNLNGGTIFGGTIAPANGVPFIVSTGTLNSVTVNGTLDVGNTYSNALLTVTNGLTLNGMAMVGNPTNGYDGSINFFGTQTLTGNGTVVFGNNSSNTNGIPGLDALWLSPSGTTLTIGSAITVDGQNGTIGAYTPRPWSGPANVSVINQGTISANVSGGQINILAVPFSNQGLVASPLGTLNLGGTLPGLGNIQSGNGPLMLSGVLTNTGQTLVLNGPTNTLTFNGGTILGGTIAPANGGAFLVQIGMIDAVTLNGVVDVGNTLNVGELNVTNGLTLNGTILVGNPTNSTWGSVSFHGTQTLSGTGTVIFGNNNSNSGVQGYNALRIWMSGTTLTIGSGITVEGQNGTIGAYASPPWYGTPNVSVINQGTISANVSGGLINILGVPFTNQGLVESPAGQLNVVNWLNTGQTITVGTNTGSLNLLASTIQGGTIVVSNGVSLVMSGNSKFIGVTVDGLLDVGNTYNAAQVTVTNGLTLNGTALVGNPTNGNYGSINFYGTQTLTGNGTVVFGNNSNNAYGILGYNALLVSPAGATLTIDSGITVEGQIGTIGAYNQPPWYGPANVSVINLGTILANINGGTINLVGQPFQNMGTLATAGGEFSGGPLAGSISATNGSAFVVAKSLSFNGVTFNGILDVGNTYNGAELMVTNGLILNGTALVGNPTNGNYGSINFYGTQTLSGSGTVVFGNNSNNTYGILGYNALVASPAGATLTIGSGITVKGQNGTIGTYNEPPWYASGVVSVTNLGTVLANVNGGTINLAAQPFQNAGTMATAGGGAFSGGTVTGTISATNGNGFAVKSLTMNAVTFNGTLDVGNTCNGAQLTVTNGLTFNGTALVGNPTNGNYGSINFYGTQTLGGNGALVFGNNSSNNGIFGLNALEASPAGATLTIGSGITVKGQNGTIGAYSAPPWYGPTNVSVTNLGTVLANVNGGTVNLAAQPFLNMGAMATAGGAFSGGTVEGTITLTGGNAFVVKSLTFNGVTFNGTLDVGNSYNGAQLVVTNGLTLNGTALVGNPTNGSYGSINFYGTQTLNGNGAIVFGNNSNNNGILGYNALWLAPAGTTLTIGSGITIEGQNGTIGAYASPPWYGTPNVSVINQGTISANISGGNINITAVPFSNQGSVQSPGGHFTVSDWLNTGQTIAIGANAGSLNLSGGTIYGGTIIASNASLAISGNSTFNQVTVDGVLDVGNTYNAAQLTVTNGLTLNGTALVGNPTNSSYGSIDFYGTQTLGGSGTVVFGNNSNNGFGTLGLNALWLSPGGTALTISSGITVDGQNGTIGAYTAPPWNGPGGVSVTNLGIISTTVNGGTIGLNAQPIVNKNMIGAETGTLLVEGTNLDSESAMAVGINGPTNNGQITFTNVAYFGGTLQAHFNAGYVANVGTKFTLLNYLSVTGAFAQITLPAVNQWQVNTGLTTLTITATKIVGSLIPVITSQPQNQSALPGNNATFAVTASNAPPFSYQWQFNGTNLVDGGQISGSGSNILTIVAEANNVGNYQVIVTNVFGSVTSSVATLTLQPVLTWASPAPIVYGTALGSLQLNATANVPGTFAYTPVAGTIPAAGINLLTVIFTPADTVNYADATNTVSLTVQPAPLTVTAHNASRPYGQNNPAFTGTLTGLVNGDNITASYNCAAVWSSPQGAYPIVPTLNDPGNLLGNYSVTTNYGTLTVTAGAPPQLTGITPSTGATNGGNTVTITGSGFELGAGVRFGSQAATGVTVNSGTNIVAFTSPGPLGTVSVTVTNPDGTTATLPNAFTYVAPSVRVALGSTVVQIGQTGAVSVTLNSTLALTNLNFTVINPSSRFFNWTFASSNSAIQNPPLQVLGSSNVFLNFNAFSGQTLESQPVLGTLYLTPLPGHSAFLTLVGTNVLGTVSGGTPAGNVSNVAGRVAVIGAEPLIQASLGSNSARMLTFYGNPGTNYEIITTTNLASPNWQMWSTFNLTNFIESFQVNQTSRQVFYRALTQP